MNDRLLVEALRAKEPDALAAVYDAYSEFLYRYCWFLLRSRDVAQVALRDTLIVAQARVTGLADPGMLKPWLYALARAECVRRRATTPETPDIEVADHARDDAELRVISWYAVDGLPQPEREALELTTRHGLDGMAVAAVLGLQPKDVQALLAAARASLEDSLTAEILARKGTYECAERTTLLRGWGGRLSAGTRERLAAHAADCAICERHRPRNVATAKVFGLLPDVPPPDDLRIRVMSCFTDPELSSFRTFVAARAGAFGATGFPRPGGHARGAGWRMPAAIVAAACAVVAVAVVFHTIGGAHDVARTIASGSWPGDGGRTWNGGRLGEEPTARTSTSPGPEPSSGRRLLGDGLFAAPSTPSGDGGVLPPPPRDHQIAPGPPGGRPDSTPVPRSAPGTLAVSPSRIDLGTDRNTATIILVAQDGPVQWRAIADSSVIGMSAWSGRLVAGERQSLTLSVDRSGAREGAATITFTGGSAVRVSWSAAEPSPSPTPTTTATGTAAPSGTAVPTRSSGPSPSASEPEPSREPTRRPSSEPSPATSGPSPEPEPEPSGSTTPAPTSSG
ncbi:MAG: hypothetical protein GEV11_19125 [Streptosporangiales bacterium]|nr:hypothetical protein [Streptosporangiales bacterium]